MNRQAADDSTASGRPSPQELSAAEDESLAASHVMALSSPDWRVRRDAVAGLVAQGGVEAVNALLRGLAQHHRDPGTLNAVLQALEAMRADVVDPLAAMLRDSEADLRIYSAHALALTLDLRAIPPLLAALDDPDSNVVYHAIESLGQLKAGDASERLAQFAESRDFSVALTALSSLSSIDEASIAPRLVPLLDDDVLRDAVLETLGVLGDLESVAPMLSRLERGEVSVGVIAKGLASIHDRQLRSGRGGDVPALLTGCLTDAGKRRLIESAPTAAPSDIAALAKVLGWLPGDESIPALMVLLERAPEVPEVVDAIVRKGRGASSFLVTRLRHLQREVRQSALQALGLIGDSDTSSAVREVLADPEVMLQAVVALARIGDASSKRSVQELLGHPEAQVRRVAVSALNSLGSLAPAEVERALSSGNAAVRESATRICGYAGLQEFAEPLLERCGDENDGVRRAAIDAIVLLDDERALAALVRGLADRSSSVRKAAARGLAHLSSAAVCSPLLGAVLDPDPWVRYEVVRSLGIRRALEAREVFLQLAVNDPAIPVRIAAIEGLLTTADSTLEPQLLEWAQSPDPDIAQAAIRGLGRFHSPNALRILLSSIESAHVATRRNAIHALAASGQTGAVDALSRLAAADPERPIRHAALSALAEVPNPQAVSALIAALERPDLRTPAIDALIRLPENRIGELSAGLRHSSVDVRRSVVSALERVSSATAAELLQTATCDPARIVRMAALRAIGRHSLSARLPPLDSTSASGEAG
ncbi:MAG: HEAT repeat domain-containing protein [Planctomycetaceae bacterium]|nr:HEAT repeat domain-containing protein [Planctomycetaceae bacterium]